MDRVLVSSYPRADKAARDCARVLAAVALRGQMQLDWSEVRHLGAFPEYRIFKELQDLVREVANELKTKNPLDSA